MTEVNRLEDCIEKGISVWLKFNGFEYDLVHMNNLTRRWCQAICMNTKPGYFFLRIEQEVNLWRLEQSMGCGLDDFNELIRDLDDRVSSKAKQVTRDEALRHAS